MHEPASDNDSDTQLKEEYRSPSLNFSLLPPGGAIDTVFEEPTPPAATSSRVGLEDLPIKVPNLKRKYDHESDDLMRLSKSQGPFSSPPRLSRTSVLQQ